MVTSRENVKKHKESVKGLKSLKKRNITLRSKLKSDKLNNKKLKQSRNTNLQTTQISNENEKLNVKSINIKLNKGIQKETNRTKKPILRQLRKKTVYESEKSIKKDVNKTLKHTLKRKHFGKYNAQVNKKTISHTNVMFKVVESRKRKSVNNEEDTNCLNLDDLSKEHILQCISAIYHLTEEQLKGKNALFDGESQPVFMQVTCIKIPKTPRRYMRILLPHSMVSLNDEVALFVGDLQRGRRKDYEPTIEHYENLLRKHDCTRIKSIIPMNQVKTEYDQFELKRKLVGSYDYFLIDGKIAGHMSHLLGKEFYNKRKLPTSIRMQSKDLKHEIEYALRKTVMQIHSYGDTHIIQIGHTSMEKEKILENILATCNYLSKNYPGGWANIRSVRIKTSSSLSLPIYTTLKNKSLVKVPIVQPKRPKAYRNVSGELTTAVGISAVTVTPEGDIITVKRKRRRILS